MRSHACSQDVTDTHAIVGAVAEAIRTATRSESQRSREGRVGNGGEWEECAGRGMLAGCARPAGVGREETPKLVGLALGRGVTVVQVLVLVPRCALSLRVSSVPPSPSLSLAHPQVPLRAASSFLPVVVSLSLLLVYSHCPHLHPKCLHAGAKAMTLRQYSPTTSSSSPPSLQWYVCIIARSEISLTRPSTNIDWLVCSVYRPGSRHRPE